MSFGLSMLWFWAAYLVVTLVGILHTVYNWKVLKLEAPEGVQVKPSQVPAYTRTIPFHVLYNIVLFPAFAYVYLKQAAPADLWNEALAVGATWAATAIVVDLIGWVLIKHPWYMTPREMYLDYQPWITLIYAAIFVSPLIAAAFV